MTTLLDNPIPILVAGVVVEIILAIPLLTTRRTKWLFWMGGVLVLTLLLLLVEHLVVTPREEVETTLNDLAAAIEWETDDLDAKEQASLMKIQIIPQLTSIKLILKLALNQSSLYLRKIIILKV